MAILKRKIPFSMDATQLPTEDFCLGPLLDYSQGSSLKKLTCLIIKTVGLESNLTKLGQQGS